MAFFGHTTSAKAKIRLRLLANSRTHEASFLVMEHKVPITLSGSVAERLGFLRRIQNVHASELYLTAQPYTDVFSGLGQLKDVEYTMKLKPGAVGVVVPARRVPVALQDKVKEKLQRMEDQGVIQQTEVRCVGHSFTTEGLKLDSRGVQDILQTVPPKNSSEQRLNDLLAATNNDSTLTKLCEYAQTAWPLTKQEVPDQVRANWSYQEEIHAQDGLVFRSNKRLMRRQSQTLLPVPSSHLEPQTVPSSMVHGQLRDIRRKQKIYYNRGARVLPPVTWPGGHYLQHHHGYLVTSSLPAASG
ncbi:uncharacterized protein LOC142768122 [Rhipicephalus microplus]|uniref:uncharacterized protein LOC142768122 n=1 Tax=Rhipicephalus microplus TaxID=6941 RepID=UPI003F6C1DD0